MTKQIKAVAATVAANKQPIRAEVTKLAASIKAADTRMAKLILQAADLYLAGDLNDREKDALLDAIPKQRKADFKAITEAPSNYREEKEYPAGLQARARYLKLRADGYKPADARDISGNKKTRKAVDEANGKAAAAPAKAKRTTQHGDGHNALKAMHDAIELARKDYADSPDVLGLLADMSDLYQDLLEATKAADK